MSNATTVLPGSINLRGEVLSWTDFAGRRAVVIEMMHKSPDPGNASRGEK